MSFTSLCPLKRVPFAESLTSLVSNFSAFFIKHSFALRTVLYPKIDLFLALQFKRLHVSLKIWNHHIFCMILHIFRWKLMRTRRKFLPPEIKTICKQQKCYFSYIFEIFLLISSIFCTFNMARIKIKFKSCFLSFKNALLCAGDRISSSVVRLFCENEINIENSFQQKYSDVFLS